MAAVSSACDVFQQKKDSPSAATATVLSRGLLRAVLPGKGLSPRMQMNTPVKSSSEELVLLWSFGFFFSLSLTVEFSDILFFLYTPIYLLQLNADNFHLWALVWDLFHFGFTDQLSGKFFFPPKGDGISLSNYSAMS